MAVITLGSPSFDPTPLIETTAPTPGAAVTVVSGATSTAMTSESDPIFTAWDRTTGIEITESQISDLQSYLLPGDNISELTNDSSYLTSIVGLNISDLTNDSAYLTAETDPVFLAWDKSTGISVDTTNIVDSAITAVKTSIAAINPVNGEIVANKVGTLQLNDDAVTEDKIQNDAVTAAKLNVAAISATGDLNVNTVGTTQIVAGGIEAANLANDAIESWAIADNAVLGPAIASDAILARHVLAGEIQADHIATGALTARHITSANFVIIDKTPITELATFTSNDPAPGSVSWENCVVMYNGEEYSITDDDTSDAYIYWEYEGTTFSTSATLPTLGNDDFLVATNDSGVHTLVWNATIINGNRITTGSVTATQIGAGAITTIKLDAGAITADKIAAGVITADKLSTLNFMLLTPNTFTNEDPSPVQISWIECEVMYNGGDVNGNPFVVQAGYCDIDDIYIYWQPTLPTVFGHSPTIPETTNEYFLVATNGNIYDGPGTAIYAWNNTVIDGNRITTGSISATHIAAGSITTNHMTAGSIDADRLIAGSIQATQIDTDSITADKIQAGAITADKITATTLSAITANLGNVTAGSAVITTGSDKIWLNDSNDGALNIGGTTKATAPFRVTAGGAVTATSVTITGVVNGLAATSIDIGDWDMSAATGSASVSVAHGLTAANIRSITVTIRSDIGVGYVLTPIEWVNSTTGVVAGGWTLSSVGTEVVLFRTTGGDFDSAAYNATSYNRGWITIQYET